MRFFVVPAISDMFVKSENLSVKEWSVALHQCKYNQRTSFHRTIKLLVKC